VDLEDIKFHQCVRLTQFDENRQIVFTPPDGEFTLMSYRLSQLELTPPFWIDCQQETHGTSRIEYLVKIRSQFKQKVQAQSVEISVPCPANCRNPVTKQNAVSVQHVHLPVP
jgi:AP-1 complex subunit mu